MLPIVHRGSRNAASLRIFTIGDESASFGGVTWLREGNHYTLASAPTGPGEPPENGDIGQMTPHFPENTKHLYHIYTMLVQRGRRWAGVVEMLYKCFVFARLPAQATKFKSWRSETEHATYQSLRLPKILSQQTRDVDPVLFQCWASVADGGPTFKQHWVSASRLLENLCCWRR